MTAGVPEGTGIWGTGKGGTWQARTLHRVRLQLAQTTSPTRGSQKAALRKVQFGWKGVWLMENDADPSAGRRHQRAPRKGLKGCAWALCWTPEESLRLPASPSSPPYLGHRDMVHVPSTWSPQYYLGCHCSHYSHSFQTPASTCSTLPPPLPSLPQHKLLSRDPPGGFYCDTLSVASRHLASWQMPFVMESWWFSGLGYMFGLGDKSQTPVLSPFSHTLML